MVTPPQGWSNSPSDLDEYWSTHESAGRLAAQVHEIDSPVAVMCTGLDSGDALHLFASGQTYYLWNAINDQILKIISPTKLQDIVARIDGPGLAALELQEVEPSD